MDFSTIAYAIHELSCTSSVLAKESILRRNAHEPGFKEVLKHLYNPYVTTGIKQAKLDNANNSIDLSAPSTTEEVLEYYTVARTGTDAEVNWALSYIYQFTDEVERWLAEGIITKDLQCGVSTTTLNKVYGKGFIPRVGIMRGMLAPASFNGVYIATEKIDGNRRLFFNFQDRVEVYTRSGRRDTTLTELEEEFAKYLPKGYMYDCECLAEGEYANNIELRQASASVLNSGSKHKTGVIAKCFDMVDIDQYNTGESVHNAIRRKMQIAILFGDDNGVKLLNATNLISEANSSEGVISAMRQKYNTTMCKHIIGLPILGIAHNRKEALSIVQPIWNRHGEGIMLVDALSTYQVSATPKKSWLKIKSIMEVVGKVLDVYEGTGKYEGALGGITVAFLAPDKKVYTCNVGSGFADYQRDKFFSNTDNIIGKFVEIECQGFSQEKDSTAYSLNCPIFKRIRGEVD